MAAFPLTDCKTKVQFRGRTVDKVMRAFLIAMEEKLGYPLTVVQGGFNAGGVSQSAGTHDLGGVVDLSAHDWENKVKVAANLGGFPYHRTYLPGNWGEHIHMGIRNHRYMDETAQRQQEDWDHEPPLDGLARHNVLTGQYHPGREITFKYDPKTELKLVPMTKVQKARDELIQGIHDIGQSAAFLDDTNENRVVARAEIINLKKLHKDARGILSRLPLK